MTSTATVSWRAPSRMMRLHRLGSFHQSRLSFMRILTRRLAHEAWQFQRTVFDIDTKGVGVAVYSAIGPERTYSLIAFAHDLPDDLRSDRVIAEAWDATFTLFDGIPDARDIARLSSNVPLQEAGRITERELTLSRANRSVRLWSHVVDCLAAGQQPDPSMVDSVGYLMRTTAVYGSGKFGAADRTVIAERTEMQVPFQAEMLSVYLIRAFVRDLVEAMARHKGGTQAVPLDPGIAKGLGIGNSTGLGMAPFLVNHPILFNNWIVAREEAIARVRSLPEASRSETEAFRAILNRATRGLEHWTSEHPVQIERLADLRRDLAAIRAYSNSDSLRFEQPWHRLMTWAEDTLGAEGEEFLGSLILEPYGPLVDGLSECMADTNRDAFRIDGQMPVHDLRALIEASFSWAIDIDWSDRSACARAWYVSAEKLEPRLGERFEEPISPYEQALAPARDASALYRELSSWADQTPIATFLLKHPEHRHTVRRAQMSRVAPYGEIHDNTISADVMPIDMLRAKLSFFGATHFDPRSDRWVRICMFAGAPYPVDLSVTNADFWVYPADTG